MSLPKISQGDLIESLPLDPRDTPLSFKEKMMFDSLYPEKKREVAKSVNPRDIEQIVRDAPRESRKIWNSFQEIIIASILFIIFQFPMVDATCSRFIKSENFYYRLIAKTAIFAIVFFILTNFSLARV